MKIDETKNLANYWSTRANVDFFIGWRVFIIQHMQISIN